MVTFGLSIGDPRAGNKKEIGMLKSLDELMYGVFRSKHALLGLLMMCAFPTAASAQPFAWWAATTVPFPIAPNDAHTVFAGTGGTVAAVAWDAVNSTAAVPIAIGPNLAGNGVDIVWAAKLAPGDVVAFTFTTMFTPVIWADGDWTNDGLKIDQIDGGGSRIEPMLLIQDVNVNLKGVATDIGDITVLVQVPGAPPPPHTMTAVFQVDPAWKNLGNWVEFQWFQIVLGSTCPGIPQPVNPALVPTTFPIVDPPNGGWDYQLPAGDDDLPWYWNAGEKAIYYTDSNKFRVLDTKTCPHAGPWAIEFRTWLVAHSPGTEEFCLIAGFEWALTDAGPVGPVDLGAPAPAHVAQATVALGNAGFIGKLGFPDWTVNAKCDIENCFAICKDGTSGGTFAKDELGCHLQCDDICAIDGIPRKDNVLECLFKGQNVKGNCEGVCKETPDVLQHLGATNDVLSCHLLCDAKCGGKPAVQACYFKGENVKGNCEGSCKDTPDVLQHLGTTDNELACHLLCDAKCGGKPAVQACYFKGENVKGNCEGTCKDTPDVLQHLGTTDNEFACHLLCDAKCGGKPAVQACYFKGENVKGNCEGVCKGTPDLLQHLGTVDNELACHLLCDTKCGGKPAVQACYFKGENVKGNCEAQCKDDPSPLHIGTAPDELTCHALCDAFCGNNQFVKSCEFKAEVIKEQEKLVLPLSFVRVGNSPETRETWTVAQVKGFLAGVNAIWNPDGPPKEGAADPNIQFTWPQQYDLMPFHDIPDPQKDVGGDGDVKNREFDDKDPQEIDLVCLNAHANARGDPEKRKFFPIILIQNFVDAGGIPTLHLGKTRGGRVIDLPDKIDDPPKVMEQKGDCIILDISVKGAEAVVGEILAHELGHLLCLDDIADDDNNNNLMEETQVGGTSLNTIQAAAARFCVPEVLANLQDPPAPPPGACCDNDPFGPCRDDVLEADCLCDKCKWYEKQRCEHVTCLREPIPTVSEWGLVVMTLLLLTGAKIYFGRRILETRD